jgi:hypothetical protein
LKVEWAKRGHSTGPPASGTAPTRSVRPPGSPPFGHLGNTFRCRTHAATPDHGPTEPLRGRAARASTSLSTAETAGQCMAVLSRARPRSRGGDAAGSRARAPSKTRAPCPQQRPGPIRRPAGSAPLPPWRPPSPHSPRLAIDTSLDHWAGSGPGTSALVGRPAGSLCSRRRGPARPRGRRDRLPRGPSTRPTSPVPPRSVPSASPLACVSCLRSGAGEGASTLRATWGHPLGCRCEAARPHPRHLPQSNQNRACGFGRGRFNRGSEGARCRADRICCTHAWPRTQACVIPRSDGHRPSHPKHTQARYPQCPQGPIRVSKHDGRFATNCMASLQKRMVMSRSVNTRLYIK